MASKRVSLKGKGAEIFFGDSTGDTSPPSPQGTGEDAEVLPDVTSTDQVESTHASNNASTLASTPDSQPVPLVNELLQPDEATHQRTPKNRKQMSKRASNDASTLASDHQDVVAHIRRTVRVPGREVSFVRLTPEEKGRLADIVYTYKRRGWKTSENEINRIAVNFLLADYAACGELSILAKALSAIYTD